MARTFIKFCKQYFEVLHLLCSVENTHGGDLENTLGLEHCKHKRWLEQEMVLFHCLRTLKILNVKMFLKISEVETMKISMARTSKIQIDGVPKVGK